MRVFFMLLTVLIASACAAPVVKGTLFHNATQPGADTSSLAITKNESIVVLSAESIAADESWPAACVRDAIASADSTIRVMTAAEFRDAMFPWFETQSVEGAIAELKTMPEITRGIEQIGVRYIISVGGRTIGQALGDGWSAEGFYIGKHGLFLCGAGPGGAGCFGFLAWQRTSDLSAIVWDLKRGTQIGAIAVKITAINLMPAVILPVPLIAPTETAVCRELGYHLAKFVTTGEVPEIPEAGVVEEERKNPAQAASGVE